MCIVYIRPSLLCVLCVFVLVPSLFMYFVFVSFCIFFLCLALYADFYLATNNSFPAQLPSFELQLYIFYALVLCYLSHDPCSRFFIRWILSLYWNGVVLSNKKRRIQRKMSLLRVMLLIDRENLKVMFFWGFLLARNLAGSGYFFSSSVQDPWVSALLLFLSKESQKTHWIEHLPAKVRAPLNMARGSEDLEDAAGIKSWQIPGGIPPKFAVGGHC